MKEGLSVVVPVFEKLPLFRNCLLSLACQSRLPDELIVSDDGSSEDVVGLLEEFGRTVAFPIVYLRQEHRGFRAGKCRNNGARVARGRTLVFCDQDLVFTKDYLATIAESRKEGTFLCATTIYLDEAQTQQVTPERVREGRFDEVVTRVQRRYVKRRYVDEMLYFRLRSLRLRYMGTKLRGGLFSVSRADFEKVNGFDERYENGGDEDDDLGFRLNAIDVVGRNPFRDDFALHQAHPPNYPRDNRRLKEYYARRRREIRKGSFRCDDGLASPLGGEAPEPRLIAGA